MASAAAKTLSKFPDIRGDFARMEQDDEDAPKELALKLKQVRCMPLCSIYAHTLR